MSQCKINTFQSLATTPQKHSYSLPRVTLRPMRATWGPSELTTLIATNKQCITYLTSEVLLNPLCVAHLFSGEKDRLKYGFCSLDSSLLPVICDNCFSGSLASFEPYVFLGYMGFSDSSDSSSVYSKNQN